MVYVKANHFGSATCSTAAFDSAGSSVTYFQKTHQSAGSTATTQFLPFSPNRTKISSYTASVFENSGFPYPQIHDATVIYQVIIYAQDKARVRLRSFVS